MNKYLSHKEKKSPTTKNTSSGLLYNKIEAKEIDELAQYLQHADIELVQTSQSKSPSSLLLISFENIDLQIGNYGAASICNAATDNEKNGIIYKILGDYQTICNGYDVDSSYYIFHARNSDHITINKGDCRWAYITFKTEFFEESIIEPNNIGLDLRDGKASMFQCQKQPIINSLYGLLNELSDLVNTNHEILQNENIGKGIESSILDYQLELLCNSLPYEYRLVEKYKKPHESIIKKSNEYFNENSYKPVHLLELCSALNISLRTLYYAFQEFYGTSPMKYLRLIRYAKARKDLLDSDPKKCSVSDIAAKWHFWQFGRFSVEYRNIYGESPSQTLNSMP